MLKEEIINLFYIEHLTVKDISAKANTSSAYVTKIIKQDNRYTKEKIYRKEISKEKRKVSQNNFIKNKREKQRTDDNYLFVKSQHAQASRDLSKARSLSDLSYMKWNCSAYKYNPSKRRYEFDSSLGRSADVPKYIKERRLNAWKKNY